MIWIQNSEKRNYFENDLFSLINNPVFGITIKNVRKHINIKIVTIEIKRNFLVSQQNYHTKNTVFGKFISNRNEKKVLMNRAIYLGLSITEITKIAIWQCCHDYLKSKMKKKKNYAKKDKESFIILIKIEDVYTDIAKDVEKTFDIWNYKVKGLSPTVKIKYLNK